MAPYLLEPAVNICSGEYHYNITTTTPAIGTTTLDHVTVAVAILGLVALYLNTYVALYLRPNRTSTLTMCYYSLCVCNACLGSVAILHAVLFVLYNTLGGSDRLSYIIFGTYLVTSTSTNSKLVYNSIIILHRALKCTRLPGSDWNKSAAFLRVFPVAWLLFLAGSLEFQFSYPSEVLLQQFIYYPESKNGREFSTLELAERGLYMFVIFSNLVCLVICLVARYWQSKGGSNTAVKRKKDLLYRQEGAEQLAMHGQDSNTDIAVSTIFLACYSFECIVLLVDVFTPDQHLVKGGLTCLGYFCISTGMPLLNAAVDPIIIGTYNDGIITRVSAMLPLWKFNLFDKLKGGGDRVRFGDTLVLHEMDPAGGAMPRLGSLGGAAQKLRNKPDIIEFADTDVESDSSWESFEYKSSSAVHHISRRFRR